VVGPGVGSSSEVLSRLFDSLEKEGAHVEAVSTSELKVTCVIGQEATARAVNAVARAFELVDKRKKPVSRRAKK
jgi:aspartate kinase